MASDNEVFKVKVVYQVQNMKDYSMIKDFQSYSESEAEKFARQLNAAFVAGQFFEQEAQKSNNKTPVTAEKW